MSNMKTVASMAFDASLPFLGESYVHSSTTKTGIFARYTEGFSDSGSGGYDLNESLVGQFSVASSAPNIRESITYNGIIWQCKSRIDNGDCISCTFIRRYS